MTVLPAPASDDGLERWVALDPGTRGRQRGLVRTLRKAWAEYDAQTAIELIEASNRWISMATEPRILKARWGDVATVRSRLHRFSAMQNWAQREDADLHAGALLLGRAYRELEYLRPRRSYAERRAKLPSVQRDLRAAWIELSLRVFRSLDRAAQPLRPIPDPAPAMRSSGLEPFDVAG